MSGETAIALVIAILLRAQAGLGPIASTEAPCPAVPIVMSLGSVTTEQPLEPMAPPLTISTTIDYTMRAALYDAVNETEIVGRILSVRVEQSAAYERYVADVTNAAVAFHESSSPEQHFRPFVGQLVAARQALLRDVESYESWFGLAKAVAPDADSYDLPDRFVERAELSTRVWTADDSDAVSAARDFLTSSS